MNSSTNDDRQKLINRAIGIQNLAQLEDTRSALQEWLRDFPEDTAIREIDEQLAGQQQNWDAQSPASFAYLTTSHREPHPPAGGITEEE